MTLDELEHTLPNGLHDAELLSISVDYVQRKLTLGLEVFVGDFDGPIDQREAYRKGRIEIFGLQFLAIVTPDSTYPYSDCTPSRIDICDRRNNLDQKLLASLPVGTFVSSIWVNNWNGFADLAASGASLIWEEDEPTYRSRREHYLPGERGDLG